MAWTKVQSPVTARVVGRNTINATLTGVTAGSLIPIVVGITSSGTFPTAITVTDGSGNAVQNAVPAVLNTNSPTMAVYYVASASAGSHQITVNLGASDSCNIELIVGPEWSGGSAVDVASALSAISGTTTIAAPAITTTANGDLVIFAGCQGGTANTFSSFTTGFTNEQSVTGGPCTFIADAVQAAKGNIAPQCTSSINNNWVSAAVSFALSVPTSNPTFVSHTESGWINGTTQTTASIAVNQGDLILVKYADAGWQSGATKSVVVASGTAIPFTKLIDVGKSPGYTGTVVWSGFAQATGNITVKVTISQSNVFGFTVEVWRNAAVGNYASAYSSASPNNVGNFSFTTSKNNSGVSFLLDDFNATTGAFTWEAGFTGTVDEQGGVALGLTVESGNDPNIGAAGAYTVGLTNYNSAALTMNAVEVVYSPTIVQPCGFMQTYAML